MPIHRNTRPGPPSPRKGRVASLRHALGVVTALLALITLSSCGQPERTDTRTETETRTAEPADRTAPDARQMAPGMQVEVGEGVNRVDVSLSEYRIEMPESLPAGPTAFVVSNAGMAEHNFEIQGEGVREIFDENLVHGETRVMQVNLAPGHYHVHCPVGDHERQGMALELMVR